MSGYIKLKSVDGHFEAGIGFDCVGDIVEDLMNMHEILDEDEARRFARRILKGEKITIENNTYELGYCNE